LPDRFDPSNKLYLTPSGQKRHPMSYGPFLGGKRICIGKTFVEKVIKLLGPSILYPFDIEFVNERDLIEKPLNNTLCLTQPTIMVRLRVKNH